MGALFTGMLMIGLLLFIAGGIGLFFSYTSFALGSPEWIQGNLTYGTFTSIGLVMLILLIFAGPEFD
jgi:hypothetical protein